MYNIHGLHCQYNTYLRLHVRTLQIAYSGNFLYYHQGASSGFPALRTWEIRDRKLQKSTDGNSDRLVYVQHDQRATKTRSENTLYNINYQGCKLRTWSAEALEVQSISNECTPLSMSYLR